MNLIFSARTLNRCVTCGWWAQQPRRAWWVGLCLLTGTEKRIKGRCDMPISATII